MSIIRTERSGYYIVSMSIWVRPCRSGGRDLVECFTDLLDGCSTGPIASLSE